MACLVGQLDRSYSWTMVGRSLMCAVVVVSPTALAYAEAAVAAEPSPSDRETSRALYADGMQSLDARDYAAAEKACRGAYNLVPLPTPAVCLARSLAGLRRLFEARDLFLSAARSPGKDGEPAVLAQARAIALAEAERLATRIPSIVLVVDGAPPSAQLSSGFATYPTGTWPLAFGPGPVFSASGTTCST